MSAIRWCISAWPQPCSPPRSPRFHARERCWFTTELVAVELLGWRRGLISGVNLRRRLAWTLVFVASLAAVVGWQGTLEKFREPEPYRVRSELLRSSLAMIADKPLTGFGLGTWAVVYPAYARFDNGLAANHAHNDWANGRPKAACRFSR